MKKAQARRDVNWSAVVAQAIEERVEALDALDRFGAKSKMTQADVDEIAAKIDRRMAKHFSRLLVKSSSPQTKS